MNPILSQLCAEFERMEKSIALQNKIISDTSRQMVVPPCSCGWPCAASPSFAHYPKLKLSDCTWDEITMYAQSGTAQMVFSVGDAKTITLKDGTTIDVRIIGFNHDLDKDRNPLPITFETVQTLNKDYRMNEDCTNIGGWEKSNLRVSLNGEVFDLLPDDLKAVIKPCTKKTGLGGNSQKTGFTTDPLFVLSEQEIFGRKIYSIGGEGHWYEWYRQEDNPYAKAKQNGERDWRRERSPLSSNTTYFCCVYRDGDAGYYSASTSLGVAFGFCV